MSDFNHGAFVAALRERQGSIPIKLYADLMASLEIGLGNAPVAPAAARTGEPDWLVEARRHMGAREVPGAKHSPFVLSLWKTLGRPYADDETPWCGGFVGFCLKKVGIDGPKVPERAKDWGEWGKPCAEQIGAIAVFGRTGGGHVGFLVGRNASSLYVLGGNQANAVNIMPIARDRLIGTRWPSGRSLMPSGMAPKMTGGTVSTNEA